MKNMKNKKNSEQDIIKERVIARLHRRLGPIIAEEHLDREILFSKYLFKGQITAMFGLLAMYVLYVLFGGYFPDFNLSKLWIRTDDIYTSVMRYWYVFAWGFFLSIVTLYSVKVGSFVKAKTILSLNLVTSFFAGAWEEMAYRGLLIFTSMIGLYFVNFAFKWVVLVILCILAVIAIIVCLRNKYWLLFLISALLSYVAIHWWWGVVETKDPLYWFYQHLIFPIMSLVSVGLLDGILYNKDFSLLFIMAAVSVNTEFRDGHKYQGTFGFFNSWILGFVFIHAMMYHGIVVAIIIHAIYDIIIGLVKFSKRLLLAKKSKWDTLYIFKPQFCTGV